MGREQPERVSREAASKAGKRLQASEGLDEEALAIAHTWRVQHLEPAARCFEALSSCSHQFEGAVVSYRLKRMKSILRKPRGKTVDSNSGSLTILAAVVLSLMMLKKYIVRQRSWSEFLESLRLKTILQCLNEVAIVVIMQYIRSLYLVFRIELKCRFVRVFSTFGQRALKQ